jgi:hypothetical protein
MSEAGLSGSEAEAAIESQLRQNNIVNDPHVSVYAKEYSSSGISVAALSACFQVTNVHSSTGYRAAQACSRLMNGRNS